MQKHLGCNAIEVLDPTLLLTCDKYSSICEGVVPATSKYLAAYVLDMNDEKRKVIEAIASKERLPINGFIQIKAAFYRSKSGLHLSAMLHLW